MPTGNKCYLAAFADDDLGLLERSEAPAGTTMARLLGPVRRGKWLCWLTGQFEVEGKVVGDILLEVGGEPLAWAPLAKAWPVPPGWGTTCPTTSPGRFVVHTGKRIELWDLARHTLLEVLSTRGAGRRLMVDEDTVLLLGDTDVLVLEDAASLHDGRTARGQTNRL
jgi:hypothetical protein